MMLRVEAERCSSPVEREKEGKNESDTNPEPLAKKTHSLSTFFFSLLIIKNRSVAALLLPPAAALSFGSMPWPSGTR